MDSIFIAISTALWLGILTSISPCPLATNIAAISFIGAKAHNPKLAFLSGILYTLGRIIAYTAVGVVIVTGFQSIPNLSFTLQEQMNRVIGPILIIVGVFLLELITVNIAGFKFLEQIQNRFKSMGLIGALLLGFLFALSFCPVSAALFFGSLVPLAVKHDSGFLLPVVFGVGTGIPVLFFAGITVFGARNVGNIFKKITHIEIWLRRITGIIFIMAGIYLILNYTLKVL